MIRENIFIVFLPRYTSAAEIQRIKQAVTNVNVFMNSNSKALSTFALFGDGITATFFVKDGADLGLYCHVRLDTNKLTHEDKEKIFNFIKAESFGNVNNSNSNSNRSSNNDNIKINFNDWKKHFIDKLIEHGRKLCETAYPCELFRKVRDLCPELLEEMYRLHSSIGCQEKEDDSPDSTPFSVYECAYSALVSSFYQNKRFIESLLNIPVSTSTSIASTPANNVFTNTSRCDSMWATIATEDRIALIIFFLFVKPDDDLFLKHNQNPQNTQQEYTPQQETDTDTDNESELTDALSRFKVALASWL